MTNPDKKPKNDYRDHLKAPDLDEIIGNLEKSSAKIRESAELAALDGLEAGARYFADSANAFVKYVEFLRKNNIYTKTTEKTDVES